MSAKKTITGITLFLFSANLLIYLFRDSGFEYKKYSSKGELNPEHCDQRCIEKWNSPAKKFTAQELQEGRKLLEERLRIDTVHADEEKMIAIAGWLYADFYKQFGEPADSVLKLDPLRQFHCLENNRQLQLHCGNFQPVSGFFFTAAGLPNRLIQLIPAPSSEKEDSHVVNEVYLQSCNKWVLTDGFRNMLIIKRNDHPLSAAEYMDDNIHEQLAGLDIKRAVTDFPAAPAMKKDEFFNEHYALYYFKDQEPDKAYATGNKFKRYFWPSPWYEIYAPGQKNTNFLFRIKQLFIFALAGWLLFLVYFAVNRIKNDRSKKHTQKL